MTEKRIEIAVMADDPELLPSYGSPEAAGADLRAANDVDVIIAPGAIQLIKTGLRLEIPAGYEIQIRPRSGLALKHGITVLNTPGTIDSDYRGEIGIILINHSQEPFTVTPKMRIAQAVLQPVLQAHFVMSEALSQTSRGEGGFGHTGTH